MNSESDQSFKDGDEMVESDQEFDKEEISCEEEKTVTGNAISDIEWIEKSISELKEYDIGQFASSSDCIARMSNDMAKIRKKNEIYDYVGIGNDLLLWMEKPDVADTLSQYQKIIEFIIHIHILYGVKLNEGSSDDDDKILLKTMQSAICKSMLLLQCLEILN